MSKKFKDFSEEEKNIYRQNMRHSAAHVLAEAVTKIFPKAKVTLGPPIKDGFYYDFEVEKPFTPENLKDITKLMQKIINKNSLFVGREVSKADAFELVKGNQYKEEILESMEEDSLVTFWSHSNGEFEDLCRGGHVNSTGEIKSFKLLSTAGAYWRGDENNTMLQRIYGTAWESKEALKEYINRIEEAEKRDHRKLGKSLNLFFFDPIAPASPFFLPNGTIILSELEKYVKDLYNLYDYKEVITPQIFNTELWKRSGHYENYLENMFFVSIDKKEFGVKPMNCPAAALVYASEIHSYRDLPLRLADFGRLHRNERSGVTHGLTRVRSFSQDDAHIFCKFDQIQAEIENFLDMLNESYKTFKFDNIRFELSLRPEKRVGDENTWNESEKILKNILDKNNYKYSMQSGEGAFYGPKIDAFVPDAIGREWQLGTVQLDFSLPERFSLEYIEEDGSRQKPVVIHRAMLGSLERFLGVLIEHLSGNFPTWLSPVQAIIIPITDKHLDYSYDIYKQFKSKNIRIEIDESNERMNAKIRNAQLRKIPYMFIIGDNEMSSKTVSVRTRNGKETSSISRVDILEQVNSEILNRF
ncbi:MAG: threonine--tRNA ligase [Dehalococcoidia bacterium]|nr:threonine--tRNA ligase [Dehalococcoidia bacterium]